MSIQNSDITRILKSKGFMTLGCDRDIDAIYVRARRNNIILTVFEHHIYFDEVIDDSKTDIVGCIEIPVRWCWSTLADIEAIEELPNEIKQ